MVSFKDNLYEVNKLDFLSKDYINHFVNFGVSLQTDVVDLDNSNN